MGSAETSTEPPDVESGLLELTPETIARFVSRDSGIPYDDALAAARDSGPLGDYVTQHWTSRDVGAVWVTFEGGYRVHIREIEGQDPDVGARFTASLSDPSKVTSHQGGASLGALNAASEFMHEQLPLIPYNLNVQEGYVDLTEGAVIPDAVIDPAWVRTVEMGPEFTSEPLVVHGGLGWSGPSLCSVGYAWESFIPFRQGSATAAHCNDGSYVAHDQDGTFYGISAGSTNLYEECEGEDLQLQQTNGGAGYFAFDYKSDYAAVIYDVAGGSYVGQFSATFGQTTGALWGTVEQFGTWIRAGGADCPAGSVTHGHKVSNDVTFGDSGGTLLLVYNTKLYLAGHISGGDVGYGIAAWIGWSYLPPFGHICVQIDPCY